MIQLKKYQERVLESLREFLSECARTHHPESAYQNVTIRVYGRPIPYINVEDPRFARMPYVCLRVPTGGGKTLLACHTAGLAMSELLHADRAVVLWLVPSNTILVQTADALRDARHPYRRALESNGFTKAEAERIILPAPQGMLPLGSQPQTLRLQPEEIDAAVAQAQEAALCGKVCIRPETGAVTVLVPR